MKSFRVILISTFLLFIFHFAEAQNANQDYTYSTYKTGIGVRLGGYTSGLTVKSFVNPYSAVEGIVGFGRGYFDITGLYERHIGIVNAPGLMWFYGGGAHLSFFRYPGDYYYWYRERGYTYMVREPGETAVVPGLDFIIGMDYKFPRAPFNVGLDLKPFVDFFDGAECYFDGALSLRFAF